MKQPDPAAFAATLETLKQPIDPKHVKTREGWTDRQGNAHLVEFVEWHTVADLLDELAPEWSHAVRSVVQIGDTVAVTCAITIQGVTREGVGTGSAETETGIKKAEHDALKRAAVKFGIARQLYQRESALIDANGGQSPTPRDPRAKSTADLVTPKQLGMIRALAREAEVDAEEECQSFLRCRTEELSKRAASAFIDHLKELKAGGEKKADEPVDDSEITPEQTHEIRKLIEEWKGVRKVEPKEIDGLAKKAGAAGWRKLNYGQARDFIGLLRTAIANDKSIF